jgi:hypothetical protein
MLDNMVITKTASPDLPGDFAGGLITINTKDIPEKKLLRFLWEPVCTALPPEKKDTRMKEVKPIGWDTMTEHAQYLQDTCPFAIRKIGCGH